MSSLDRHILNEIHARPADRQAVSVAELARVLGANPQVVLVAARRLVEAELAAPWLIQVHGVPTLRGLTALPRIATD